MDQIGTIYEIWHHVGPEMTCWDDFRMILHGCWGRSSHNIQKHQKTWLSYRICPLTPQNTLKKNHKKLRSALKNNVRIHPLLSLVGTPISLGTALPAVIVSAISCKTRVLKKHIPTPKINIEPEEEHEAQDGK